jgi:hypothetical protein
MKRKQIENAITIWTLIVRGIKIMPAIMAQSARAGQAKGATVTSAQLSGAPSSA